MKVLFDHLIFQEQKVGGVSKALVEMIKCLPKDIDVEIGIKESNNIYLHENQKLIEGVSRIRYNDKTFLGGIKFKGKSKLFNLLSDCGVVKDSRKINLDYCTKIMKESDYDVFQHTQYDSYFLRYNKKPFVFIVHDIIPELFPAYYPSNFNDIVEREKLIPQAHHIVAISENTKKDIMNRWNVSEERISVIHWGAPDVQNIQFKHVLPFEYVLFVGGRNRYKRFAFFVREAKSFLDVHKDVHVVCTGTPFTSDEKLFLTELGLVSRVHQMMVSTDELYSLYHYSICFVFPSEYEGFGLPILESMACGCPALISKKSCFPEIGGEAALYIEEDKYSDKSNLSSQLDYLYRMNQHERDEIVSKSLRRVKLFTWEKTAQNYAEVYRNVACKL